MLIGVTALVEHVFPQMPVRRCGISFPKRLRYRLKERAAAEKLTGRLTVGHGRAGACFTARVWGGSRNSRGAGTDSAIYHAGYWQWRHRISLKYSSVPSASPANMPAVQGITRMKSHPESLSRNCEVGAGGTDRRRFYRREAIRNHSINMLRRQVGNSPVSRYGHLRRPETRQATTLLAVSLRTNTGGGRDGNVVR